MSTQALMLAAGAGALLQTAAPKAVCCVSGFLWTCLVKPRHRTTQFLEDFVQSTTLEQGPASGLPGNEAAAMPGRDVSPQSCDKISSCQHGDRQVVGHLFMTCLPAKGSDTMQWDASACQAGA